MQMPIFSHPYPQLVLLLGALAWHPLCFAESTFYKWVDQHGVMQYSETPPPPSAKKKYKPVMVSTHVPVDVRTPRASPPSTNNSPQTSTPDPAHTNTQPTTVSPAFSPATTPSPQPQETNIPTKQTPSSQSDTPPPLGPVLM